MSLKERGQEESSKVCTQERETFGRQVGANRGPKVAVTGAGTSTLQQNNGADAETSFPYREMSRMILYDHDEYSKFREGRYSEFIQAKGQEDGRFTHQIMFLELGAMAARYLLLNVR